MKGETHASGGLQQPNTPSPGPAHPRILEMSTQEGCLANKPVSPLNPSRSHCSRGRFRSEAKEREEAELLLGSSRNSNLIMWTEPAQNGEMAGEGSGALR